MVYPEKKHTTGSYLEQAIVLSATLKLGRVLYQYLED